ncbi:MAG: hypothetical protein V4541_08820 [Bacteroidota bacterium]
MLEHQSRLLLVDTSHNDFTLMLWPKGNFTFSMANGFTGEAEKMLLTGKNTHVKTLNIKDQMKQDSTAFTTNYARKKQSSTIVQKNKLSRGYNWAWLLIVALIFSLIWAYNKFKLF